MKIAIILAVLVVSAALNLYFIFQPKRMYVSDATGFEGYFEEYDCLGLEDMYCAALRGTSACREYYCRGLLINKRCYSQKINEEGKITRETEYCRFR